MNKLIFSAFSLFFLASTSYANDVRMEQKISDLLSSQSSFSIFAEAVKQSGLSELFDKAEGNELTIFVPDNAAFAMLSEAAVDQLFSNKDLLRYIVEFHISESGIAAKDFQYRSFVPMINGRSVSVMIENDEILIDESKIIESDIKAYNGRIHVIDKVLGSM